MQNNSGFWHHLSAAPHRSLFLAGALQGVFTLAWLLSILSGVMLLRAHLPYGVHRRHGRMLF